MPIAEVPSVAMPAGDQLRARLARLAWILNHPQALHDEEAKAELRMVWEPLQRVERDLETVQRITVNPPKWLREQLLPALNATTLPAMAVECTRLLNEIKLKAASMSITVRFQTSSFGYVRVTMTESRSIPGYDPTEYDRQARDHDPSDLENNDE